MTHESVVMEHKSISVDLSIVKTLLSGMRGAMRRSRLDEAKRWLDKIDAMVERNGIENVHKS